MKVGELVPIINDDEMICIEDKRYNCLEINDKRHLSNKYMESEVVCCYGERYKAYNTIGTTITINQ